MKSIAKKMSRIAGVIGHRSTTEEGVKRLIDAALAINGVAVGARFEVLYREDDPSRTTRTALRWTVRALVTFFDSETGEALVCEAPGSGTDATSAYTAAQVCAYATAFGLVLGAVEVSAANTEAEPAPKVLRLTTPAKSSTVAAPTAKPAAPRKAGVLALWDELASVRDTKSMRAWFVRYVPAIVNWSPENKSIAWARIVAHCAPLGMSESELVAIRTEVIEHQEGA